MKPRMKPRETETRMLGWHSRLRLVFAGRRAEDQIQQVCFNQFILSKTPNQRDRIVIRWISCKNFTKLRHKGTLGRFIPILANWQRRRYVTKDWQKDLTDLRWRGNGCIIYRFSQGKNRSFRVWSKVFWARDYLNTVNSPWCTEKWSLTGDGGWGIWKARTLKTQTALEGIWAQERTGARACLPRALRSFLRPFPPSACSASLKFPPSPPPPPYPWGATDYGVEMYDISD